MQLWPALAIILGSLVVPKKNGYRTTVREAFARTVLHDLVRNSVHLGRKQLSVWRKSDKCGGNDMDGVVWILAQAPGSFTLLGLFDPKTVLMHAAQDEEEKHDSASISFRELVQLYMDIWRKDYREGSHVSRIPQWITNYVSDFYVQFCLSFAVVARFLFVIFLLVFLLLLAVMAPYAFERMCGCHGLICISKAVSKCGGSLLFADMSFRVLWLLMINTAFLQVPPLILTSCTSIERVRWVLPGFGEIPPVSLWNPLPLTTLVVIGVSSSFSALCWGCLDWSRAKRWEHEKREEDKREPEDRFQDPTCHFLGCACICMLVTILMVIYVRTIVEPLEMNPKRMGLWFGALLVQVRVTLDDKTFQQDVKDLQRLKEAIQKAIVEADGHESYFKLTACEFHEDDPTNLTSDSENTGKRFRRCCYGAPRALATMGLLHGDAGESGNAIIVYTLPLWLCRGGLVDFVLNAFALVYIVELDDLKEEQKKTWDLEDQFERV
eukprot:Skav209098  [mRNA]  locus=scaffold179:52654:58492:+ [translate_table: standard]